MEDYKGNSLASKSKEKEPIKPMEFKGSVKKKNDSLPKLLNSIFASDAKTVKNNVITNVIIPGIKKMISESFKSSVDGLLYGGEKKQSSTYDRVSWRERDYTSYSSNNNQIRNTPGAYRVNDYGFVNRSDADSLLDKLKEYVARYGVVSIADFYDFLGEPHNFTDNNYGWTSLDEACVSRGNDDRWYIRLPKVILIK